MKLTNRTSKVNRIKALIAALRSGEYKQGTGTLRDILWGTEKDKATFCCEGVGCDLLVGTLGEWEETENKGKSAFLGAECYAPPTITEYYGLETLPNMESRWIVRTPVVFDNGDIRYWKVVTLAESNDAGHSFEEIATLIEDYYLKGGREAYLKWLEDRNNAV